MKRITGYFTKVLWVSLLLSSTQGFTADAATDRYAIFEATHEVSGNYENPYTDLEAVAEIRCPDGTSRKLPLFWDGGDTWKLRISPYLVGGLVLAWGDKRKVEPYAWRRFPSLEARKRYARYIGARYGAFDVYFIVSGEWNGEVKNRSGTTEEEVKQEFIEIGKELDEADIHSRMMGMHPMTSGGTVREFNEADWMSFGDYQQNYAKVHRRILDSRAVGKPVVNSEYGYYLRDSSYDGEVEVSMSPTNKRTVMRPPVRTYWLLCEPGKCYVVYVRGLKEAVIIKPGSMDGDSYEGIQYNPRTGVEKNLGRLSFEDGTLSWLPPDENDWVLLLNRVE